VAQRLNELLEGAKFDEFGEGLCARYIMRDWDDPRYGLGLSFGAGAAAVSADWTRRANPGPFDDLTDPALDRHRPAS